MTSQFKKKLSLMDLTIHWLRRHFVQDGYFQQVMWPLKPALAGILSWIIGALAVLILGIIYCELDAALTPEQAVLSVIPYFHMAQYTRIFIAP